MTLRNKSIIITGASKGIGKALALQLANQGLCLGLVARSETELLALKKEVEQAGSSCIIVAGSVADENVANAITQGMVDAYGKIDILVNNAGYGVFGSTDSYSAEQWSDVYDTNVKGTFLMCKAALSHMKTAKEGHIINVASDVARRVFDGGALYCSSKFAQDAFSMALRKEVRTQGIKVSVVYSGLVDTMFHAEPQGDPSHDSWLKASDMADAIQYIMNQPKHIVIDELMIHPTSQDW